MLAPASGGTLTSSSLRLQDDGVNDKGIEIPPVPFAPISVPLENGMVNDGPFAWLAPYLDIFGIKKGRDLGDYSSRLLAGGAALPSKVVTSDDADVTSALRIRSDEDLTNISLDERERRARLAEVCLGITVAYAFVSSVFLDDGYSFSGHLSRFAILLPLFSWRGLVLSAESGL